MSTKKQNKKVKVHIKSGDRVIVLCGKDKGRKGNVLSIDRVNYRAIVEGVNIVVKHNKPVADQTEGSRVEQEAPVHISNLMLVDASDTPFRIGRKRNDEGKMVRYSKKTGDIID